MASQIGPERLRSEPRLNCGERALTVGEAESPHPVPLAGDDDNRHG
jgi:hypothetical protein